MSDKNNQFMQSRSPLKAAPLRYPGQSLDEEIDRVWDDELTPYFVAALFIVFLAMEEWYKWFMHLPPHPVFTTVIALVAVLYVGRKYVFVRRKIRNLRLARNGERVVGQYLEELRERGYRVLHDIIGEGFNIDHLLIGPKGIFTVETKTISKPAKGKSEIDYDGSRILINGCNPDRDPVVQAKAQANWIRGLVKELTGKAISVQPTVVYPGWYVNQKGNRPEVWVLNPKALASFIENSDGELSDEEVHSFYAHLSRYVRNTEH